MKGLLGTVACVVVLGASGQSIDLGGGISITGVVVPFDSMKHKITRCDVLDSQPLPICLIDGQPFFGADLSPAYPYTEITSFEVVIKGLRIPLDVSGMFNTRGKDLHCGRFWIRGTEGGHELMGMFSDGAGSYMALWKILAGGSMRTLISNREEDLARPWPEPVKR